MTEYKLAICGVYGVKFTDAECMQWKTANNVGYDVHDYLIARGCEAVNFWIGPNGDELFLYFKYDPNGWWNRTSVDFMAELKDHLGVMFSPDLCSETSTVDVKIGPNVAYLCHNFL